MSKSVISFNPTEGTADELSARVGTKSENGEELFSTTDKSSIRYTRKFWNLEKCTLCTNS